MATTAVSPVERRLDRWDTKLSGDFLSTRVAGMKAKMKIRFEAAMNFAYNVEVQTKTILDEEGTSTMQYVGYIAFAKSVGKAVQRFQGASLINRVNIILERFVSDGFTQTILERIRDTVFTLGAPGP